MPWAKVSSLVCRFWSLPGTNGPKTQSKWKLTQSCWRLHWFLLLRADIWRMRLHVYTRLILIVTQARIEKPCTKTIEIGFQSAVFHLCQRALVPLLCNYRGTNATPLFRVRENRQSTSYNLHFLQSYVQIWVLLDVIRGWRSLVY